MIINKEHENIELLLYDKYIKFKYNNDTFYCKFMDLLDEEYDNGDYFIELLVKNISDNTIYSFNFEDIYDLEIMSDEEITKFNRSKNND